MSRSAVEKYSQILAQDPSSTMFVELAKAFIDNPGYSTLVAVERWNGVLPHTMLPGSALPFVSVPQNVPAAGPSAPATPTSSR